MTTGDCTVPSPACGVSKVNEAPELGVRQWATLLSIAAYPGVHAFAAEAAEIVSPQVLGPGLSSMAQAFAAAPKWADGARAVPVIRIGHPAATGRTGQRDVDLASDFLDCVLRTVRYGEPCSLLKRGRHGPVVNHGRQAVLIDIEQLGHERVAPGVTLALGGIDTDLHRNTTGSTRGPRT